MRGNYASIRRRDGNASDAIAAILNPNEGYREKLKKKGIEPKDYERENKLRLKQMQKQNREQRLREVRVSFSNATPACIDHYYGMLIGERVADVHAINTQEAAQREAFKLTRFKGVRPRVYKQKESRESTGQPKHEFLRRGSSAPALSSDRQSEHDREEPQKQKQSMLPPAFSRPEKRVAHLPLKEPVPSLEELEERSRELVAKMTLKEQTDFINSNAWEVIKKSPSKPPQEAGNPSSNPAHYNKNFGRIPKYLLERKEQWAREEEERRLNAPDPDCPPGMMLLDEDERLRTLRVLRKSLDEARLQMNHLPLRIETPSQIRRKNALEAKLQDIEDAINVFDRSKVYVAMPLEDSNTKNYSSSNSMKNHDTSRVLSSAAA